MVRVNCEQCGKSFCNNFYLTRHIDRIHNKKTIYYECILCHNSFSSPRHLSEHKKNHQLNSSMFEIYKTSLKSSIQIFRHICPRDNITVDQCFSKNVVDEIEKILLHELNIHPTIKFSIIFGAEYILKDEYRNTVEIETFPIRTEYNYISRPFSDDLCSIIREDIIDISNRVDDLINRGSGWVLNDGNYIDLEISRTLPLSGSAGSRKTNYNIPNANYIHTVENIDDYCFLYALASSFIGKDYNYSCNYTPYKVFAMENFIFHDFEFPFKVHDVAKFERHNSHLDLSINVLFMDYGIDNKLGIFPAYISKTNGKHKINLLLTLSESENSGEPNIMRDHYHYITDLDKFLRKRYKTNGNHRSYEKKFHCMNCLSSFCNSENRDSHQYDCKLHRTMNLKLSNKPERFNPLHKLGVVRYVGFFDFESINEDVLCDSCKINPCSCIGMKTKTIKTQRPICFTLVIVDSIDKKILFNKTYSGDDAVENFLRTLENITPDLQRCMGIEVPINMSPADIAEFNLSDSCHICKLPFTIYDIRVRDHDHNTGKFLGPAHQSCNLNRRNDSTIPLYCHNFSGYDSHPILQCLSEVAKWQSHPIINILPKNTQRIRTLKIGIFTLLDSLAFLKSSLDNLVNNLKQDGHIFTYLPQGSFLDSNDILYSTKFDLLTQKGVFPYDFATSLKILKEQKSIPNQEAFFSMLRNSNVSNDDYYHAQKVFYYFNIKDMQEYMELYCQLDTILLCEVFNKFREITIKDFGLDPAKCISLPSLAYNAMLKITNVSIDPLTDVDMYNMIKKGIRGGHSYIAERILKTAHHDDEPENDFVPLRDDEKLLYIDCNNLYGTAMMYKMPIGGYRWLSQNEINTLDFTSMELGGMYGYIAEVDLEVINIF